MKYIKTYEQISKDWYNVDDYIILDIEKMKSEDDCQNDYPDNIAKVKSYDPIRRIVYPYSVVFYDGLETMIKYSEILGLATPEEIEEFDMKQKAEKYNL